MRGAARILALLLLTGGAGCATSGERSPVEQRGDGPAELRLPRYRGGTWDIATERGNVVLINYFATWCLPCVSEWPFLVEMQHRYRAEGLRVVGVCMDTGPDADEVLDAFLGHFEETNFPVLRASPTTYEGSPWPVATLPTTIIVDRRGKALGKWEGVLPPRETEELIRSLVLDQAAR